MTWIDLLAMAIAMIISAFIGVITPLLLGPILNWIEKRKGDRK